MAANASTIVDPLFKCLHEKIDDFFPGITGPGGIGPVGLLPVQSMLILANLFTPPTLPTIDMFEEALSPPGLPKIPIELPGIGTIRVGDVELDPSSFDPEFLIKLAVGLVTAPFNILLAPLEAALKNPVKLPDILADLAALDKNAIIEIILLALKGTGLDIDDPELPFGKLAECVATILLELIPT